MIDIPRTLQIGPIYSRVYLPPSPSMSFVDDELCELQAGERGEGEWWKSSECVWMVNVCEWWVCVNGECVWMVSVCEWWVYEWWVCEWWMRVTGEWVWMVSVCKWWVCVSGEFYKWWVSVSGNCVWVVSVCEWCVSGECVWVVSVCEWRLCVSGVCVWVAIVCEWWVSVSGDCVQVVSVCEWWVRVSGEWMEIMWWVNSWWLCCTRLVCGEHPGSARGYGKWKVQWYFIAQQEKKVWKNSIDNLLVNHCSVIQLFLNIINVNI